MTWLRTRKPISMNFFKANTTGLQSRDLISVKSFLSEYACLTRGKVTAGSLDCYKSTLMLWIWSISWFSRIFKDPPLSKIRKFQEIDEIKRRNGIFVENQKFTESHHEILRRKAVVDCFDCYERMPNRDILEMCLGWYQPRHISSKRPSKNTTIETCLCAMLSFRKLRKTFFKTFF